MLNFPLPVLGFAAYSGSGKTTLLKKLLPLLTDQELTAAVVKHAHHAFEVDQPGKDSYELRKAGAAPMLVASGQRMAMMLDFPAAGSGVPPDPDLAEMIDYLPLHRLDCVLVEGFKAEAFPKIEIHRPETGKPLIAPEDPTIIAVAANDAERLQQNPHYTDGRAASLPLLDLNQPEMIADFIIDFVRRTGAQSEEL